jgi:hypothetical protein
MDFAIPFGDQQMPLTCTLGMDLGDQAYSVLLTITCDTDTDRRNLLPICPVKKYHGNGWNWEFFCLQIQKIPG